MTDVDRTAWIDNAGVEDHVARSANRQITLVCDVFTTPALAGDFVGRVEVVATGEIVTIRDLGELTALLRRLSDDG